MPTPQTYKNHARWNPPVHFFVLPMLLLNFGFAIYLLVHHWPQEAHQREWWVVMSLVLFVLGGTARGQALKAQDRVIRLEEKLRYQTLLGPLELAASQALTLQQVIALRFASDAELPGLIDKAVKENLAPKQIKQSIVVWRPDYDRV